MSAARNVRLAWLAQELCKGKTNAQVVLDCMVKFPGVSETTARKDLKDLLQRLQEIEIEGLAEVKARYLEIGFKLLEECRSVAQYGPAVNQFKTLATIAGVLDGKGEVKQEAHSQGTPESQVIRDRINALMKSKKIQQEAKAAGVDLEALKED